MLFKLFPHHAFALQYLHPNYAIINPKKQNNKKEQNHEKNPIINTAIKMISKFKLSIEEVATELNISMDELKKHLDKQ
ncbi:MAG: hypothetical protein KU28_12460 [Sulfurovum sp. PC08-66]|nr:MAG: hypothetical protein KU28_12460 [Sulfurovum sp. PC08-66]